MCESLCKGYNCLKAKCTQRIMLIANILAVILIWGCIILRILSFDKNRKEGYINTQEFIIIVFMSPFQFFFSVLILLAELKKVLWVRMYFNFLDSRRGRGCFIIFITLTLFDGFAQYRGLTIILGIVLLVIGFLNILLFCRQQSDGDVEIVYDSKSKQNV